MSICEEVRSVSSGVTSLVVSCWRHVWEEHRTALLATLAVVTVVKARRVLSKRNNRQKWSSVGKNVVVVHGFPRSKVCPNLSPFVVKLETYLRMAGIKYEYDTLEPFGPKGKAPWITLNGEDYTDSQLIQEMLAKKFNLNFSSNLSQEQLAVARAMQIMTDEHMLWFLPWWRFLKDPHFSANEDLKKISTMVYFLTSMARWKVRQLLHDQGLGRHSEAEVVEMMRKDVEAVSFYLGKKPFLMGDSPCEVDCAVFGMMTQIVWGTSGSPFEVMVQRDYRNIQQYCFRMKEKFWSDWDDVLAK